MKVAIVHDYLHVYGGAEGVVNAIWELYPKADIYSATCDREVLDKANAFKGANIIYPKWKKNIKGKFGNFIHNILIANLPIYFEGLDLRKYDLVISSSAHFAKGVITSPDQLHIAYIHTPPRFLYGYPGTIRKRDSFLWKIILSPLDMYLRFLDFSFAQRPDYIVCNSKEVERRINKYYRRNVDAIINPFPNVKASEEDLEDIRDDGYFLIVSRLENYKNIDLAINVCGKNNIPLKVVGKGTMFAELSGIASKYKSVEMFGFVSDKDKTNLYKHCHGFLCTVKSEDFGMTALEAMVFGKPVVALRDAGFLETVVDGVTGIFFDELTEESLLGSINKFNAVKFNHDAIKKHASGFSKDKFKKKFKSFVDEKLDYKRIIDKS